MLLDEAKKNELTELDRDYMNKLKDAIYDADDLFDELVTQAERKKLFNDDNIFEKQRQHRQRAETLSYVCAPTVVGRDDDAREVIGMLLDSANPVNFLTIVGMGGVGKTTLAKLVFNEEWIKSEFDLRLWVCVSDQDRTQLDVKDILVKIVKLLDCEFDSSSFESLHSKYQRKVEGKRFLLVLDDVWNENAEELNNLKDLLMIGGSGCRIIATTRSMKMARIVRGGGIHELQGLSNDSSQHLFEMTVFGKESKPTDFVEISEKIAEKCSNIPLVIKVVGSLLRGQTIAKWQTFLMSKFSQFVKDENGIMSVLKLSYDHLDPSLKSCFAYCAIFPKDYVISKEMLMHLWNAQEYIVPFEERQSIDNAGEEHFSVLLQRCFFQDVKKNKLGDVVSVQMHDLMHDLAQRVSGNEICVTDSSMPYPEYKVRHIFVGCSIPYFLISYSLTHGEAIDPINSVVFNNTYKSKIRSYLMWRTSSNDKLPEPLSAFEMFKNRSFQTTNRLDKLLTYKIPKNWRCLRALVLRNQNIRVPDTIGNLLHLRYLNLSFSIMKKLPDSIVKLYNLKALDISWCEYLKEWPKEFSKLVNLTHLYWDCCSQLNCMPVGMSKLSRLSRLTEFVVEDESESGMQRVGQLKDLRAFAMNLKDCITISFNCNFKSAEEYDWEGSCLEDAQHLTEVEINFPFSSSSVLHVQGQEEIVMEKMKPNPNLKSFMLTGYSGDKIARWGRARDNWGTHTFLPKLVFIEVVYCERLQELPVLSKLRYLKSLHLSFLKNLEYMEEEVTDRIGLEFSGSRSLDATFFPSLESLELNSIENLKGWWRSSDSNKSYSEPAFPNLSSLIIVNCPRLVSFPPCLSLPKLKLEDNSTGLRIRTANGEHASSS